jgi:hypothetical protein
MNSHQAVLLKKYFVYICETLEYLKYMWQLKMLK